MGRIALVSFHEKRAAEYSDARFFFAMSQS